MEQTEQEVVPESLQTASPIDPVQVVSDEHNLQPQLRWKRVLIGVGIFLLVIGVAALAYGPVMNFFAVPHGMGALAPTTTTPIVPTETALPTDGIANSPLPTMIVPTESKTGSYTMNVLVLSYFPLTSDGKNIDLAVTGDWGESYQTTLQKTRDQTKHLKAALETGTKYLGYKNPQAQSALNYNILAVKEYTQAVPMKTDGSRKPDYSKILLDHDICKLVNEQGLTEVWLWAYQGPTYPGSSVPYLNISESKMSGPYGDISNSYRENDMPQCGKTYRLYVLNYQRGTAEALHSWGHQLEAEMDAVNVNMFRSMWQGSGSAVNENRTARCGDVHFPPNATKDYEYDNKTPYQSDCLDWQPSQPGKLTQISCNNWGCENKSDTDNPQLNYLIWNMQNLPGIDNGKTLDGVPLRNWWEVHGDFDGVMGSSKRLTVEKI